MPLAPDTINRIEQLDEREEVIELILGWREIVHTGIYRPTPSTRGRWRKYRVPRFLRNERKVIEKRLGQIIVEIINGAARPMISVPPPQIKSTRAGKRCGHANPPAAGERAPAKAPRQQEERPSLQQQPPPPPAAQQAPAIPQLQLEEGGKLRKANPEKGP